MWTTTLRRILARFGLSKSATAVGGRRRSTAERARSTKGGASSSSTKATRTTSRPSTSTTNGASAPTPRLDFKLRSRSQWRWVRGQWRSHMAETLQTLGSAMFEASKLIETLNRANRFNGASDQEEHAHAAALAIGLQGQIKTIRSPRDPSFAGWAIHVQAIAHAQPIIPLVRESIHKLAPLSFDPQTVQDAASLQSTLAKMAREVQASLETRKALAAAKVLEDPSSATMAASQRRKIRKAAL